MSKHLTTDTFSPLGLCRTVVMLVQYLAAPRTRVLATLGIFLLASSGQAWSSLIADDRIKLVGLFCLSSGESYAYIVVNNTQHILKQGDEVETGIVVQSIRPRSIKLSNGNKSQIILLSNFHDPQHMTLSDPEPTQSDQTESEVVIKPFGQKRDYVQRRSVNLYEIDRHYLHDMVVSGRLFNYVSAEKTELDEYRITHLMPGSFLTRAGLQQGDILKSLDGEEISDLSSLQTKNINLKDKEMVELAIERGEQVVYLYFMLRN
jgi:type II secretory pathway component PulC